MHGTQVTPCLDVISMSQFLALIYRVSRTFNEDFVRQL